MLNFNHLYYFHIAATEGSIKGASERLRVTQPTVSEQLRMLERSLGVSLFERTSTGLKLTQAGRDAYEHTTAMFLAGERLVETLGRSSTPPGVVLRIGVSAAMSRSTAANFLMPVLTVENCRPAIRTGEFRELLQDLRAHELDLVVGETEPAEVTRDGLVIELLHRPELVAVVRAGVVPAADWSDLSLLEYRTSSVYYWQIAGHLRDNGLKPSIGGELDDAFLSLEAVMRGGFVAFLPKSIAQDVIRAGKATVLTTLPPGETGIYAVYPDTGALEVARVAVERLISHARHEWGNA